MKKSLILLICTALCVSLTACRREKSNTTTTTPAPDQTTSHVTEPPVPDKTEPFNIQLPMIAISMPLTDDFIVNDNGITLFSGMYQDVALVAPNADAVDRIMMTLLQLIDRSVDPISEIKQLAKDNYKSDPHWLSYFYHLIYNPVRLDEKVLSLFGNEASFTGGVHPVQTCVSANFDMATGKLLALKDIIPNSKSATAVSQLVIAELTKHEKEYQLYQGFADIINERLSGNSSSWEQSASWYFSNEGLCFYFSPYDIAPYVAGEIQAVIPYNALEGILLQDFLPPKLPDSSGVISADLSQDIDFSHYTQFAELILDSNGERIVLHSDSLVTDVRLETGFWSQDAEKFIPNATVFSANTLCKGDAIMVQTYIPDGAPNLLLSYRAGTERHQFHITQSGKDGRILLLPYA